MQKRPPKFAQLLLLSQMLPRKLALTLPHPLPLPLPRCFTLPVVTHSTLPLPSTPPLPIPSSLPPPTPFADTLPPTAAPAPAATEDMSSSESEYSEELSDDDEVKFLARGLNASVNVLDTSDSSEEYMEAGGFSQEQYFTPKKLNPKKKQAKESKREAARKPTPGPSRKQPARNGKK
ncbi:unknown protein [Seminavis robusta]|uniref:Uncharacterized protein n=1 Tax=Seminavis robusta TaxID=568900 RepID=A0A9N8EV15_9STRA|nr:unknown protein [Seminavis robusta]|eukprot:Sro1906_g304650.1 n/a (177) ;mRNA; r:17566-18096